MNRKFTQEEIQAIKDKSIAEYLSGRGIDPVKKGRNTWYYYAFDRSENAPSLAVSLNRNKWKDFGGDGGKGDIIDLHMMLERCSFQDALADLSGSERYRKLSISQQKPSDPVLLVDSVRPLKNNWLINYIKERKVNVDIARIYCREVGYHFHPDKPDKYFGVGFRNKRGGFEIRNPVWKGGTTPKDITEIMIKNGGPTNIFEGFFDFLSALTYYRKETPDKNTVVLNTLSFASRIEEYEKPYIFLDNNSGVDEVLSKLNCKFVDQRKVFKPYEDFNDFIKAKL